MKMIGVIVGDIIGSPYEFTNRNGKRMDFELFTEECHFTDDTVMSLAVAEGIMNSLENNKPIKEEIIKSMQYYGRKYPYAGYGGTFYRWIMSDNPKPYHSFGNGSAMRVSSVAWIFNTLEDVETYAKITAEVTHDHPEGIKGAVATAVCIFLARKGKSKEEIRSIIANQYGYDVNRHIEEIRPTYQRDVTCQGSVPEAIIAFLDSTSFEDTLRLAVSLGGDTDTQAAIAGGIAEAYYGVPSNLKQVGLSYLDENLRNIYDRYLKYLCDKSYKIW